MKKREENVAAKKAPKKAAPKKSAPKKSAKKITKKPAPASKKQAKTVKAAPKKNAKKASAKKAAVKKKASPKMTMAVAKRVQPKAASDLSHFVTPLDDRILVRLSGAEKMTAGGLYIPDTVADVSGNLQGMVVSVGRGHRGKKGHLTPMDVRVGDKVLFPEYAGSKIEIQNEELVILRESEVMGIVAK